MRKLKMSVIPNTPTKLLPPLDRNGYAINTTNMAVPCSTTRRH